MKTRTAFLALVFCLALGHAAAAQESSIQSIIEENYGDLESLYEWFHSHPELSLQEDNTSDRLAEELRAMGYSVTEDVGGHGVVAVLENGSGPTVMVRSDLDALPIDEETGVAYASDRMTTNPQGEKVPVMHACGHDMHMSVMVGTAEVLAQTQDEWTGTVVLIGQPAEEKLAGAQAMIEDGLFERFPRPEYVLALHVNSAMASGKVGYTPGYAYANVDGGTITVKGRGGHGAYPNLTVDPVVLASKLVMDLQTIVSREISALKPAVISVGSIHGGTSGNIIPNEVTLELTLRSFSEEVREKLITRIRQRCEAIGRSAGLPEEDWPTFELDEDPLPSLYNDPELASRMAGVFEQALGEENVSQIDPVLYGEDFAMYGRVEPEIPIIMFSLGSQDPADIKAAHAGERTLPSTHSSEYLPDTEPTMKTGIFTMSSAVFDLLTGGN